LAVQHLKLPIDLYEGLSYEKYTQTNLQDLQEMKLSLKAIGSAENLNLDERLGMVLLLVTFAGIYHEILHRYLLETVILPKISSHFSEFSIVRTCLSTIEFTSLELAAKYLDNSHSKEPMIGHFIDSACLGIVCSLAQHHFGLIGAIFLGIGSNISACQHMYNITASDLLKVKQVNLADVASIHFSALIATVGLPIFTVFCTLGKIIHYFESTITKQSD
ncbi:MAG: hypothetical protein KDK61_07390, partial [Simkania sp.]|nr:hypothetical protein [Simkania sp.]